MSFAFFHLRQVYQPPAPTKTAAETIKITNIVPNNPSSETGGIEPTTQSFGQVFSSSPLSLLHTPSSLQKELSLTTITKSWSPSELKKVTFCPSGMYGALILILPSTNSESPRFGSK